MKQKLRLAMFVNCSYAMPQKDLMPGSTAIALQIADGMAERGHSVTLFAAEGSKSKAKVVSYGIKPISKTKIPGLVDTEPSDILIRGIEPERSYAFYNHMMLGKIYQQNRTKPFDVIHHHQLHRAVSYARTTDTPHVFTMHDPMGPLKKALFKFYSDQPNVHMISISDRQARTAPGLPWYRTVYNGVELEKFPLSKKPRTNLMFMGRMIEEKGPQVAIEVAETSGLPLKLYGPHEGQGTENQSFWEKQIAPRLNRKIKAEGYVDRKKLAAKYAEAIALLMPVIWEEPFGMGAIEAMATGTPVIGFRHGAVPEIIKDGVTGYLVNNVKEMVEAVKQVDKIDPERCRDHVIKHFSREVMLDNYEKVYQDLVRR